MTYFLNGTANTPKNIKFVNAKKNTIYPINKQVVKILGKHPRSLFL